MTRVELPCGCAVLVDHEKGDRLVRCGGGRDYAVFAEEVCTVLYTARPLGAHV